MKKFKSISYAFPGSVNAESLGFGNSGCWHVKIRIENIEGSGQSATFLPFDAEGFERPNDPDLIALFLEEDGQPCPRFMRETDLNLLREIDAAAGKLIEE